MHQERSKQYPLPDQFINVDNLRNNLVDYFLDVFRPEWVESVFLRDVVLKLEVALHHLHRVLQQFSLLLKHILRQLQQHKENVLCRHTWEHAHYEVALNQRLDHLVHLFLIIVFLPRLQVNLHGILSYLRKPLAVFDDVGHFFHLLWQPFVVEAQQVFVAHS